MTDQSALALPTQFALHLMASLVGIERLNEYLDDSLAALPLYWKTDVDSTSSFADISMTIDDTKLLKVSVGLFQRDTNGADNRYLQGVLTEDVLTKYLESVGIDVETTDPPVMAKSMAQAFRSIASFEAATSQAVDASICIPLYHQDVEESGSLRIEETSDCALTLAAATMILSNLNASSTTSIQAEYDTTALEQSFVERTTQQATGSPSRAAPVKQLSPEKQVRPIRPPRGGGVRAGGNKKKKAKTLSYGAAKK